MDGSAIGASAIGSTNIYDLIIHVDVNVNSFYGVADSGLADASSSFTITKVLSVNVDENSEVFEQVDVSSSFDLTDDKTIDKVVDFVLSSEQGLDISPDAFFNRSVDLSYDYSLETGIAVITLPDGRTLYIVLEKPREYVIPQELRTYFIDNENRTFKIN